jgi:hypothetical protein
MDRAALHSALDLVLDAVVPTQSSESADELVPITREALGPLALEYAPILALAQAGTLKTVWIGRRRYTKRSWLVALADTLPPATGDDARPVDDLAVAARKRANRRREVA